MKNLTELSQKTQSTNLYEEKFLNMDKWFKAFFMIFYLEKIL